MKGDADSIYPVAEQTRQDSVVEVVYKLRLKREGATAVIDPSYDCGS